MFFLNNRTICDLIDGITKKFSLKINKKSVLILGWREYTSLEYNFSPFIVIVWI